MSRKTESHELHQLQHEAEHVRSSHKMPVSGYLFLLFGAAFLLLLLSYFMQQRTNQETINGLKDSVKSFQSVGDLVEQNKALQVLSDELTDQSETLQESARVAQARSKELETQLLAMDWFWRIQRAYSSGNRGDAATLVEQFEATDLPSSLPTVATAVPDSPTPAEQYDALLAALGMQKATP